MMKLEKTDDGPRSYPQPQPQPVYVQQQGGKGGGAGAAGTGCLAWYVPMFPSPISQPHSPRLTFSLLRILLHALRCMRR